MILLNKKQIQNLSKKIKNLQDELGSFNYINLTGDFVSGDIIATNTLNITGDINITGDGFYFIISDEKVGGNVYLSDSDINNYNENQFVKIDSEESNVSIGITSNSGTAGIQFGGEYSVDYNNNLSFNTNSGINLIAGVRETIIDDNAIKFNNKIRSTSLYIEDIEKVVSNNESIVLDTIDFDDIRHCVYDLTFYGFSRASMVRLFLTKNVSNVAFVQRDNKYTSDNFGDMLSFSCSVDGNNIGSLTVTRTDGPFTERAIIKGIVKRHILT